MIKNYANFVGESTKSKRFSIYDFYDWLRSHSWGSYTSNSGNLQKISKPTLVRYVEQFFGQGEWSVIEKHFNKLFEALRNTDIDYIQDRLYDIFDEYIYHDSKYVVRCMAYGDISNFDQNNETKYRGLMSWTQDTEDTQLRLICKSLYEILHECLFIYNFSRSIETRVSDDEMYVTSDKFSMKNFSTIDLEIFKNIEVTSLYNFKKFLQLKNKYTLERCLDMFKPMIYISIGSYNFMASKISYKKIRQDLEDVLPSALHGTDYEDIIWDMKLPEGLDDVEIYDFSLKILLNMK